jgi:protein-tyrosine-phosphatase
MGFQPNPTINPGPMSLYALQALRTRGIEPAQASRLPARVRSEDFLRHQCVIALSETEHHPIMERMFPEFAGQVHYWQVEDLSWEHPANATARIDTEVGRLLKEFG